MSSECYPVSTELRLVFAGTPNFAAIALAHLLEANFNIVAVYTQPDRPAGRGHKLTPSPVKKSALAHDLPVRQPENFRDSREIDVLAEYNADLMIVAAYGIILPTAVLMVPTIGCINIHASLLPRWRGAAPIQRAILAGDTETGITIMQMEAGLDTGPMLLKKTTPIKNDDTAATLHDRLAKMGGEAVVDALLQLSRLTPEPQQEELATYAHKLLKEEGSLDWSLPAKEICRRLRALTPWPGCFSYLDGNIIKVKQAEADVATGDALPGTILKRSAQGIRVACGDGCLNIICLQLPGARAMAVTDFVNGNQNLMLPYQRFSQELG